MNEQTVSLIRELADRLGTTTNELIEMFLPRVVVGSVAWAVLSLLFAALTAWAVKRAHASEDSERGVAIVLSWAALLVAALFVAASLADMATVLASPRAAAVLRILEAVRGE